ncbi:MAG: class I SAM-dependent methyltransferase [Gemmatimonadota bacterium]|nr:MAG: class I SAM-dependent methyltransferase [Gemmatimonadota bacterium]
MRVRYPSMKHHFARVAPRYRQMRDLDVTAVRRIARIIRQLAKSEFRIVILDVGSGTGRYLESVLAESALETTHRCCALRYDVMREMLGRTSASSRSPCRSIKSVVGLAECLPFAPDTIDAVLTFNAIHHFNAASFLAGVGRVLRPGGKLIIYTRTPEQNRCTVWGTFFPRFAEKEDRLLTETELAAALDQTGAFGRAEPCAIPWKVETSLSRLIDQARGGAYSTFEFYSRLEFEEAVQVFERRVVEHFKDPSRIMVQNDHLLAVAAARSMS